MKSKSAAKSTATIACSLASGATVQITLGGNTITNFTNDLNADLTGDMVPDVNFSGTNMNGSQVSLNIDASQANVSVIRTV